MSLATVPEAITDFKAGKFVIVVDDEDRRCSRGAWTSLG
jgi:3,4-dihydroxy-2-butanone 4-phosphate synthase